MELNHNLFHYERNALPIMLQSLIKDLLDNFIYILYLFFFPSFFFWAVKESTLLRLLTNSFTENHHYQSDHLLLVCEAHFKQKVCNLINQECIQNLNCLIYWKNLLCLLFFYIKIMPMFKPINILASMLLAI